MPRCDCYNQETSHPLVPESTLEICLESETATCDCCGAKILIRDAIMDEALKILGFSKKDCETIKFCENRGMVFLW